MRLDPALNFVAISSLAMARLISAPAAAPTANPSTSAWS